MKKPTKQDRLEARQKPAGTGIMYQTWKDLLFMHWIFPPEIVQRNLPPGLHIDTYEGKAYIGVTPFFMRNVRPKFWPPLPGLSNFLELNVRTYVHDDAGRPGVWFFSLDCNNWLAVPAARIIYCLPYFAASMKVKTEMLGGGKLFHYKSARGQSRTEFVYRPNGPIGEASPDSLEFFLVERYILFAWRERTRQLYSAKVHHPPYHLVNVEVKRSDHGMLAINGFLPQTKRPDHQVMSPGVTVEVFPPEKVGK